MLYVSISMGPEGWFVKRRFVLLYEEKGLAMKGGNKVDNFEKNILYEDKHLLIYHKLPGIPVQSAGVGALDLECACLNYFHKSGKDPAKQPYVGIVHRLDQPVEGLLAIAKTRKAAKELSKQAQDGTMGKEYLALVEGEMEPAEGMLEDWLIKDSKSRMGRAVPEGTSGAKKARLLYRTLRRREAQSLLEIRLLTGRFHQIRVQLSYRGHPLVGDRKYNSNAQAGGASEGIGLCAHRLRLLHPISREEMTWEIWPEGRAFFDCHA